MSSPYHSDQQSEDTRLDDTFLQGVDLEAAFDGAKSDFNDTYACPPGLLYGDGQKMSESEDHPVKRDEDSQPVGMEQKIEYLIKLIQSFENTVNNVLRDNKQLTEKCATLESNQKVLLKALGDANVEINKLQELTTLNQKQNIAKMEDMFREKHNIILWDRSKADVRRYETQDSDGLHEFSFQLVRNHLRHIARQDISVKPLKTRNQTDRAKFRLMITFVKLSDAESFLVRLRRAGDTKCHQGAPCELRDYFTELENKIATLNENEGKNGHHIYRKFYNTKIGTYDKRRPSELIKVIDEPLTVDRVEKCKTLPSMLIQELPHREASKEPLATNPTREKNRGDHQSHHSYLPNDASTNGKADRRPLSRLGQSSFHQHGSRQSGGQDRHDGPSQGENGRQLRQNDQKDDQSKITYYMKKK